jgi:hypothetical protein
MLLTSTLSWILLLSYTLAILRSLGPNPPDMRHLSRTLNIALICVSRYNVRIPYCIYCPARSLIHIRQYIATDFTVVWRAWALWPNNPLVKWTLAVAFAITFRMFFKNLLFSDRDLIQNSVLGD